MLKLFVLTVAAGLVYNEIQSPAVISKPSNSNVMELLEDHETDVKTKNKKESTYNVNGKENVHAPLTWLPPERCKQEHFVRTKRDSTAYPNFIVSAPGVNDHAQIASSNSIVSAPVVNDITQIALNQNKNLIQTYNNSKFFGVPISGSIAGDIAYSYEIYVPNECKFHTYSPSLLSSVYCQEGVACKLVHAVSTTKSYTSSEGYNWGVKISAKATLFPGVFEIGGEVSSGGSYTCTYTEGRTTTDTVECSVDAAAAGKTLQLYNVQSDMECQFSTVTMVQVIRNGSTVDDNSCADITQNERKSTLENAIIKFWTSLIIPDVDRMPDELWEKIKLCFPYYNPYTDLFDFRYYWMYAVWYYKEQKVSAGAKRIIPFTNENGNSVYQYACVLT